MKLEPCPFCGSGVLHKNNPEKMGRTFFVSCGLCDCRGACLPTERGAVDAWNTRAPAFPAILAKLEAAQRLRDAVVGHFGTEGILKWPEIAGSVVAFNRADKEQS